MRTTVALDSDIEPKLRTLVKQSGKSLRQVINELLRVGLANKRVSSVSVKPFKVTPHHMGFKSGLNPLKLNQLVDKLAAEDELSF